VPPGNNQDELNIPVGISNFDDLGRDLERIEALLQRARKNAENIFLAPNKDTDKFADHITALEKKVVSLTSQFATIGKAGTKGFEDLNKVQLDVFDRLVKVQTKLQSIDSTLTKDVKPSTLVRRKKEAIELEQELDRLEKKLLATKTLDIIQKRVGPGLEPVLDRRDVLAERAQKDIQRMANQRKQWEKDVTDHVTQEAEKQFRARTSTFQRGLNALLKGYRTIEQQEAKLTEKRQGGRSVIEAGLSKLGLGGLSGGLGPLAAVVATGYAIQRAYSVAEQAIERASEQARANRTLASSAAEAGISIDFLTKKNKEFAQLTALSEVKATTTVAKITQLATLAQTPQNIEKLTRGFANLGAARGLDATGIETVVQQIITGQDEGYKKLLLPNPAQLQAKYARENNRSVGSLTAVEKAQIFQAEFLKKAELFNGAAEARLASVDGRAAKLNASFENLANNLSTKFANNYDIANFIDGLTASFNKLNAEVSDLAGKVERGINIDDLIKSEAKPGILGYGAAGFNTVLSGAATAARGGLAAGTLGISELLGIGSNLHQSGEGSAARALNAVNSDVREDFIRQQVNAEIRVRALNRKVELERRVQIAADTAKEEQERFKATEETRLTDVFKDKRANASTVLGGLSDIRRYSSPLAQKVDLQKAQEETLKRFNDRDVTLDNGKNVQQIMDAIGKQVVAEMQAAVDQKNLPLFSDTDKQKLLKEGESVLEELAKKAHELVKGIQEDLVNTLADQTDNPFVKLLDDADHAAERTREKFARLGPALAGSMGQIAEAAARQKLSVAEFESSDRELRFRQQARRLEQLPATQTDAFERRLQRVETEVQYQLTKGDTARGIIESQFYGTAQTTGKARKLREAFLRSQYGDQYQDLIAGARGTREEKDAYREIGVRIKEAQKDVDRARRVDTQGLGVYSRGAVAEQLLGRLPTTEELLPRLRGQGRGREEAQGLFRTRESLLRDKQAADEQKFNDFIANQKFIELNRKDAQERAKNLFDKGGALPEKNKLDKFLQITDELGTGELTPELRQQRVKALNARADIEANEKKVAADQLKTIADFTALVKAQVEQGGLKVTLSETPIVEVQVNASGVAAELDERPRSNR
jgi:hypothetical protein